MDRNDSSAERQAAAPPIHRSVWQVLRGRVLRGAAIGGLLLVVGIGSWFIVQRFDARGDDGFAREYQQRGGTVTRGQRPYSDNFLSLDVLGLRIPGVTERGVVCGVEGSPIYFYEYSRLGRLQDLEVIDLPRTELTPNLIAVLGQLPQLQYLRLENSNANNELLAELCRSLENSRHFRVLELGRTEVTEEGLGELRRLKPLCSAVIRSRHIRQSRLSLETLHAKK